MKNALLTLPEGNEAAKKKIVKEKNPRRKGKPEET
jgi:hypothetical protein